MRIVSPFLKKVLYPSLSKAGVFRRMAAGGLAVVTYHGVLPPGYELVDSAFDGNLVSAETFRQQLRLLKRHYTVLAPEDVLAWCKGQFEMPPRAVLLTCDDGLLNHLTDMLPVLRQEELRCLFFVTGASAADVRTMLWYEELFLILLRAPAGRFEITRGSVAIHGDLGAREQRRALWWDAVKQLSRVEAATRDSFLGVARTKFGTGPSQALGEPGDSSCRRFGLLTRAELLEVVAAGMTIGAHTMSHPMLSQAPQELARAEVAGSRTILESVLQKPVWALAYPFGDAQSVAPKDVTLAEQAGYTAAFLNFGGGLGADLPRFAMPRLHVTAEMSLAEFEAHVSGFYAGMQRLVGRSPYALAAQNPAT